MKWCNYQPSKVINDLNVPVSRLNVMGKKYLLNQSRHVKQNDSCPNAAPVRFNNSVLFTQSNLLGHWHCVRPVWLANTSRVSVSVSIKQAPVLLSLREARFTGPSDFYGHPTSHSVHTSLLSASWGK